MRPVCCALPRVTGASATSTICRPGRCSPDTSTFPRISLGIEAYIHNGHEYTYFGVFPSLLRMPLLLVTHALDGRVTAPSMLIAWLATALFSSLLIWRVRILIRGSAGLGRAEAAALGLLVASIAGGSVLIFLAANPYVYSEDLAWSVAVTIGSLFALLGVLEQPSWGRLSVSGALILAACLTRAPTGYACVIGAVLVTIWFATGRGGAQERRWWPRVLVAALVPLAVSCAVNFAKLGVPFGLPITEGIAFKGLGGPNNGHEFSIRFLPSTLANYLGPNGVRLTTVFPFITMPDTVAEGVAGVSVYGNRTASVPASMPLLFVFATWGVISAFRPRQSRGTREIRLLLFAAATGVGAILIFGWIYDRYLADFLPFLVLGAAVGLVDAWRRLEGRSRQVRASAVAVVAVLALVSIAINLGIAITPTDTWSQDQLLHYVQFQKRISDVSGHTLTQNLERGYQLPNWAPADRLFVIGDCADLYISDGEGSPVSANGGIGWLLVEHAPEQSLCRTLIADQHLTHQQVTSLNRAAEASGQVGSAFETWAINVGRLGKKPPIPQLAGPSGALVVALQEFDSTIKGLAVSGQTKVLVGDVLYRDHRLQDDLAEISQQTESTLGHWQSLVTSDWARVTSASASLVADLGSSSG